MERESHPVDKMREEHHSLMRLVGGDDLSLGRESMNDLLGQVSGLPELLDVLLLNGGGHPLASSSGSGHDWSAFSDGGS